ncbi:MAG: SDR family NAD(P)-dependent oxidoreductase [Nitrosopumilaceae archaeon]
MSIKEKLSDLQNKEILVTGGAGFIGSEVTKQLSNLGAKITVLDNLSSGKEQYIDGLPNVNLIKADLLNDEQIKSAVKNKDYIINLAALPFIPDSYYYPKEFFEVNVNATIALALAVIKEKKAKRFIHISSSEIYGNARYIPMDENHPTTPQSTYAVSKLAGDRVVFTMHKEHNLPSVIIRPFNSFGPNITQPYIIPEIISQALRENEVILGNINSKRDFTFVSDTARAIILSLITEGVVGETLNVGSERSISIKDVVSIIAEILNKDITISIDPSRFRPYDVDTLVCDFGRAFRLMGWKPETSIKDGLEITIDWIKKNGTDLKIPFKGWVSAYRNNQ